MKPKAYKLGQLTSKTLRREPLRAKKKQIEKIQLRYHSHSKTISEHMLGGYEDYLAFLDDCHMIACYEPSFYQTFEDGRTFLCYYDDF